ncbi:MAG: hypothetical protein LBV74_19090 [Tannerella sp.]|jgi:hypothetical protein|nr:hypothetical protein [Tannerella sp.]
MDKTRYDEDDERPLYEEHIKIKGWLSFFLIFGIGAGAIITLVFSIIRFSIEDYITNTFGLITNILGLLSAGVDVLLIPILAGYTIYSFYNFKPNAVFLGKVYLVLIFVSNIILLLAGEFEHQGIGSLQQVAKSLIWGIVWFIYLCVSTQVNRLYPKQNRKIFNRDLFLIGTIAVILMLYFISVFLNTIWIEAKNELIGTPITRNLSEGEYSDGRIAFVPIDELDVEKQITEDNEYFHLYSGDSISITLISMFENDDTPRFFEECMSNWIDEDFLDYEYRITDEWRFLTNGNSVHLKILQYESDPIVNWSFALVFNKKTNKCALLSSYSRSENELFIDRLIKRIHFE